MTSSHLRPLRRVAIARDVAHGVGEHAVVDVRSPRHGGTRREEVGELAVRQTVVAVLVVLVEQVVEELHALIRQLRAARRRHFDAASRTTIQAACMHTEANVVICMWLCGRQHKNQLRVHHVRTVT